MVESTIFDFARMCSSQEDCSDCPLYSKKCDLNIMSESELEEVNKIIIKWCNEHQC